MNFKYILVYLFFTRAAIKYPITGISEKYNQSKYEKNKQFIKQQNLNINFLAEILQKL